MKKTYYPHILMYIAIIWFLLAIYFQLLPVFLAAFYETGVLLPYIFRLSMNIAGFLGLLGLTSIFLPIILGFVSIVWFIILKKDSAKNNNGNF
jgi:hypothetical protein